MKKYLYLLMFFITTCSIAQKRHILKIQVIDEQKQALSGVTVTVDTTHYQTDYKGELNLNLEINQAYQLKFKLIDYQEYSTKIYTENTTQTLIIVLPEIKPIEVIIFGHRKVEKPLSAFEIKNTNLNKIPSLTGGVEELLKSHMVNSNTELSSQYMVRGGNYDENLVYINGIELFRPQLVRSGQQEGMSFLNANMVENIYFSAGGFEAKYGDKMASILDIYYKEPQQNELALEGSLLGGSLTGSYASKNKKLAIISGARYRDISLLLNTQDDNTDFDPRYMDFQANIIYRLNQHWKFNFMGGYGQNKLNLIPKSRETVFGTINNPYKLEVNYDGEEHDLFQNSFAAFNLIYKPKTYLHLTLDASIQHGIEQEYFDIESTYKLGVIDPVSGAYVSSFNTAGHIDHARNDLDFLISSLQHRGQYKIKNAQLEWGVKYQIEDFRSRLDEYHRIDSAAYIRPVTATNTIAYLYNVTTINNKINLKNTRISAYAQYNQKYQYDFGKLFYSIGLRTTHLDFNKETTISPRLQIAFKPKMKYDMLFRFATGLYYQTPFFKDLRDIYGNLTPTIKSQRAIHFIAGHDYEFRLSKKRKEDSPFKLTTELYYKKLDDLNPYYIDNVRILYWGVNQAKGSQYGIDMRLNGNFVKQAESWFSISYARSKWNINGQGNIPMPTDQGLKLNLYYQDYMPQFPSFRVYLNAVYATGLPNGAPLYTNLYDYTGKLSAYKRLDIGFNKIFIDEDKNKAPQKGIFSHIKELAIGAEIFNLFDIQNHISNLWIEDLSTAHYYAVPNRLTGRFFNLKLQIKF